MSGGWAVAAWIVAGLFWTNAAYHFGKARGIDYARRRWIRPALKPNRDWNKPRRTAQYLPGDLVRITLPPYDICNDSHNGNGVVIYGPDDNDDQGWIVSSAPGSLRCVADELTMITPREDRKP